MKTYSAKPSDITRNWYIIDASEDSLGRIATKIATKLTGKEKPLFTHHIDCGDFVIVINAANLKVTGNKMNDKYYYRHSGYPGGLKSRTLAEQIAKDPTKVIYHAVKGMLPTNKLEDDRLKRLKVYAGADHKHEAQQPTKLSLKKGSQS